MERKDIEYFFIWTTIKGAKTRFRSLSAIGECAKHGCASSPAAQNAFFLKSQAKNKHCKLFL